MSALVIPDAVRAELVEALSFFCKVSPEGGQPFDKLRANGVHWNGGTK